MNTLALDDSEHENESDNESVNDNESALDESTHLAKRVRRAMGCLFLPLHSSRERGERRPLDSFS